MVVDKDDLIVPSSDNILVFSDGETVDSSRVNANNANLLGFLISLTNYCIDQTPQVNAGVISTYTDLQMFNGGIRVSSIKDLLNSGGVPTNQDIVTVFEGTGKFKYGGTASNLEVATQLYVTQSIASASVGPPIFAGATDIAAGSTGIVPVPVAGQTRKLLTGGAVFGNSIPFNATIQTGNFNFLEDQFYEVDLSSIAIIGTLPAAPTDGARVGIKDINRNAASKNFTFARNGKTMEGVSGLTAENIVVNISGASVVLEYRTTGGGWYVI